jgi:hypothetical protein
MKSKNFDKYKEYASNQDKNQPEHVLKLFLNFEKNSASCSYKLGSYPEKSQKGDAFLLAFFVPGRKSSFHFRLGRVQAT